MDNNTKATSFPPQIPEFVNRCIQELVDPNGSFVNKIQRKIDGTYKKDIIIKFGVDPTRPDIHLGHAVVLRLLRSFQDIGCKVVFLIGDFTAGIGDPTGKSKVRPEIQQKEVEQNMQTYLNQVVKILRTDESVFSWMRNSDWFYEVSDIVPSQDTKVSLNVNKAGMNFDANIDPNSFVGKAVIFENSRMQKTHIKNPDVQTVTLLNLLWTLRQITHSRLIARDLFQERIKAGEELFLHEMMYPVFQGIDSYIISKIYGSCDLEVGGTDQTFNMLMGRDVMKINKVEEQAVLSLKILKGTDGKEKMSKSLDNYISINESVREIFGKTMSIPDSLLREYFELCTYVDVSEVERIMKSVETGEMNPRDAKVYLAKAITAIYYGEENAKEAEYNFNNTFKNNKFPDNVPIIECTKDFNIGSVLVEKNIITSKTEWRRLVDAGAVTDFENGKIIDPNESVGEKQRNIKIGKKTFVILKPE